MTDKQPEAYAVPLHELLVKVPRSQRLEIEFDEGHGTSYIPVGRYCHEAAAELRRLHEENQQWQEKCNTYMELHDAVVKDSDRLYALNAELVEALKHYVNVVVSVNEPDSWEPKVADGGGIARKAIAKAQGDNNG